jgi:hypothetical protein
MSPIIQEAIDNKPFILQVIANLKANKDQNSVFNGTPYKYTDSNIPAKEFLSRLFYIWQLHPQHWGWSALYNNWNLRILSDYTSVDALSKLPKEHYDLLPPYVLTKVKKHKSTHTLDTKTLIFDEFALATFTMWLESKKKLTSTECLAMLKQIGYLSALNISDEVVNTKLQYINLLWQYTPTKSIDLCKFYTDHFTNSSFIEQLPVAIIFFNLDLATINESNFKDVTFPIYWYQLMAQKYSIPVSQSVMTTQHSTVYQWITGVARSTPLNAEGLQIAIDQIIILTAVNQLVPELAISTDKMKQHLMNELLSGRYPDAKQLLADRLSNLTPIQSTLKDLHDRL